jgi:hypothetical protein
MLQKKKNEKDIYTGNYSESNLAVAGNSYLI